MVCGRKFAGTAFVKFILFELVVLVDKVIHTANLPLGISCTESLSTECNIKHLTPKFYLKLQNRKNTN